MLFSKNKILIPLFKQSTWSVFFRLISLFLNFLSVPIVIDIYGINLYGEWVLFFSLIGIIPLIDFGVSSSLRNYYTKKKSYKTFVPTLIFNLNFLVFFVIINALIVPAIFGFSIMSLSFNETFLLIFLVPYFALYSTFSYLLAISKVHFVTFFQSLPSVFFYFFLILIKTYNLESFIGPQFLITISYIVLSIVLWVYSFKTGLLKYSLLFKRLKHVPFFIKKGLKIFILQFSVLALIQFDRFAISSLLGVDDLVNYDLLFRVFSVYLVVSSYFSISMWSFFARYTHIKNSPKYILNIFVIFLMFAVFCNLLIAYFLPAFTLIWLGENAGNLDIYYSSIFSIYIISFSLLQLVSNIENGRNNINYQVNFLLGTLILFLFCLFLDFESLFKFLMLKCFLFLILPIVFLIKEIYYAKIQHNFSNL